MQRVLQYLRSSLDLSHPHLEEYKHRHSDARDSSESSVFRYEDGAFGD